MKESGAATSGKQSPAAVSVYGKPDDRFNAMEEFAVERCGPMTGALNSRERALNEEERAAREAYG